MVNCSILGCKSRSERKMPNITFHRVKSDRINALRKQYDAFLEEDKKRKERNEYILGRLDNMRYNATAVQIRHKPIAFEDTLPVYNRGASQSEQLARRDIQFAHPPQTKHHSDHQNLQLDVHKNYLDNTSLLKEISKKYILIPKLRPSLVNDYDGTIPPQLLSPIVSSPPQVYTTSNEDWKSKYDILEQLKKEEKHEQTTKYDEEEIVPVKETQKLSIDNSVKDIDSYNLQNCNTKEFNTKYESEVPEKDLTFDKITVESEPLNVEKLEISDFKEQQQSIHSAPQSSDPTYNTNPNVNTGYDNTLQSHRLEHKTPIKEAVMKTSYTEENVQNNYSEENPIAPQYNTEQINHYNDGKHQLNENIHQEEYPEQYEQPVEVQGKYPNSENVYSDNDKLIEEPTGTETNESKDDEVDKFPVDMISVQEFTPADDVKLIDGVNINPNYLASEQNSDPLENTESVPHTEEQQDSSGIEAFDAEQKEMFYSENTQELGYNPQESGNVYNQEYTQDTTDTQEHTYYESPEALQEQEYPVEVNEHEESTMQYDQNYEQQYATDYGNQEYQGQEQQQYDQPEGYDQNQQQYDQPEGYDQNQQQYDQPEGYDQNQQQYDQPEGYDQNQQQYDQPEGYDQNQQQYQEYEYQEADQETVQNVEQVLDNEQGYVTEQNVVEAKENSINQAANKDAY